LPSETGLKMINGGSRAVLDIALNAVFVWPGVDVALCSMVESGHLEANVEAISDSLFSPDELRMIMDILYQDSQFAQPGGIKQ
jgi:aryl-alcohol dehydrogenase-like predicted oxidoreductase